MRKNKKGFTIVELVIVVAVIAVLTAVLVPTFIHLSSKAKDSIDKTVVKNANIQLAAKQGLEGKNKSMSDAVKDVDEIGYHIPGVSTGNDNKIVWDSEADRFVLLNKDNEVLLKDSDSVAPHSKLFKAVSSLEDREDFAVYAKSDYPLLEGNKLEFTEGVSFDTGDLGTGNSDDVSEVYYHFSGSGDVLLATSSISTKVFVNAPSATFKHAGKVGEEYIGAVADHSYHELGKVGFAQVSDGQYVAENGSDIKALYATSNDAIINENGGNIGKAYGPNDVTNPDGNVTLDHSKSASEAKTEGIKELEKEENPQQTRIVEVYESNDFVAVTTPIMFTRDEKEFSVKYTIDQDTIFNLHAETLIHGLVGIAENVNVTINLNGYQFKVADLTLDPDGECAFDNIMAIYIGAGATLTMYDSVGTGGYMMQSYMFTPNMPNFFALFCNYGTLVLDGGTYRNMAVDAGFEIPLMTNFGTVVIKQGTTAAVSRINNNGGTIVDERA